jgi:hypothetical protein
MSKLELVEALKVASGVALGAAVVIAGIFALGHAPLDRAAGTKVTAAVTAPQPRLGMGRYNTTDIRALPATSHAAR